MNLDFSSILLYWLQYYTFLLHTPITHYYKLFLHIMVLLIPQIEGVITHFHTLLHNPIYFLHNPMRFAKHFMFYYTFLHNGITPYSWFLHMNETFITPLYILITHFYLFITHFSNSYYTL